MDAPPEPPRRMDPRRIAAAAGVVAALLALGWWLARRGTERTDDAFIEARVLPISSKVAGHVDQVLVDDNQEVKQGQLLVQLEAQDFELAAAQARAELAAADAEALRASADAERARQLFGKGQVSKQSHEHAEADANVARAKAELARRKLEAAELDLSYTKITAAADGKVTKKNVERKTYVQIGQPLFALVTHEAWVVANFKETQLTHMKPGQAATVRVDAYPHRRFKAHVDSIQSGTGARFSLLPPENATGNFIKVVQRVPVKIVFDENTGDVLLAPGMSVEPVVDVR